MGSRGRSGTALPALWALRTRPSGSSNSEQNAQGPGWMRQSLPSSEGQHLLERLEMLRGRGFGL